MVRQSVLDCNPHEPSDIYIYMVIFYFALKPRRSHSCGHPGLPHQRLLDASMDTPLHHGQLTAWPCVHSATLHSASSGNRKLKLLLHSRYGGTCSNSIGATWELQEPLGVLPYSLWKTENAQRLPLFLGGKVIFNSMSDNISDILTGS